MDETITVMGVKLRRSPVSCASEAPCAYLENGFCRRCTCEKCRGGYLIDEWRQEMLKGHFAHGPRECACVERARSRKRLRDAGLEELAGRCSFDSFRTDTAWQKVMKQKAQDYLGDARRMSFFISGQSGCGKTHLCTAVCNEIIRQGGRLRYLQWVRDGTRLKQLVVEREAYEREIAALIETPYLYIDDLFKQELTAADIRLAYEILGGRYNKGRPVILSSERSLEYIRAARGGDGEAVAGRIFESCGRGKYCLELSGAEKNLRFQGA